MIVYFPGRQPAIDRFCSRNDQGGQCCPPQLYYWSRRAAAWPACAGSDVKLLFVHQQFRGLAPALAQLGGTLSLVYDTGFLVETATAHFGQHTVALHHFIKAPKRRFKGLIVINGHARHNITHLLAQIIFRLFE